MMPTRLFILAALAASTVFGVPVAHADPAHPQHGRWVLSGRRRRDADLPRLLRRCPLPGRLLPEVQQLAVQDRLPWPQLGD